MGNKFPKIILNDTTYIQSMHVRDTDIMR